MLNFKCGCFFLHSSLIVLSISMRYFKISKKENLSSFTLKLSGNFPLVFLIQNCYTKLYRQNNNLSDIVNIEIVFCEVKCHASIAVFKIPFRVQYKNSNFYKLFEKIRDTLNTYVGHSGMKSFTLLKFLLPWPIT